MSRKGKWNGYMSVEASCIMPIVLFCLLFVLYMGFWEYDKCVVEQDIFVAMIRGSNARELSSKELNHYLSTNALAENKYVYLGNVREEVKISEDSIFFQWQGRIKTILEGSEKLIKMQSFALQGSYEVKRYNPVSFIRNCRKVERGIDRIRERL